MHIVFYVTSVILFLIENEASHEAEINTENHALADHQEKKNSFQKQLTDHELAYPARPKRHPFREKEGFMSLLIPHELLYPPE